MSKCSRVAFIPMILAGVLTIAVPAMAADPIIGTWKLNIVKSKFSPFLQTITKHPKERTEVYREIEGDQIEMTSKEIQADSSPSVGTGLIWPKLGGMVKGGQAPRSWVETWVEPGKWYVTALNDGKQLAIRYKTVSKDGKTMVQTIKGLDPTGKPFEQIEVFDRQ